MTEDAPLSLEDLNADRILAVPLAKGDLVMDDDVEIIEIRLATLNKTVALSREMSANIWAAVKSGEASTAEEYVNRKLEEGLLRLEQAEKDRSTGI